MESTGVPIGIEGLILLLKKSNISLYTLLPHIQKLPEEYKRRAMIEICYYGGIKKLEQEIDKKLNTFKERKLYSDYYRILSEICSIEVITGNYDRAEKHLGELLESHFFYLAEPAIMLWAVRDLKDGRTQDALNKVKLSFHVAQRDIRKVGNQQIGTSSEFPTFFGEDTQRAFLTF